MAKVIIHTNENGGVSVTYPAPEFLEENTIEDVLAKDCPDHAIIIDDSELPEDHTYFNAWELIDGKVLVNEDKKQAIIDAEQQKIDSKTTAQAKLAKLGLTSEDLKALLG
jgi:hypothetical protein